MARMIEFNIKVDYRNVTEFLEKVNPVYEKQVIFVQGIHGIMSVFNVSYSKARELAQGVLRPSIYKDDAGLIWMNLRIAYGLYYKDVTKGITQF